VSFMRNRESRSREAAGRRNWPEAVPMKMRGGKRRRTGLSGIGTRSGARQERIKVGKKTLDNRAQAAATV
jgi:hypothetical protein